MLKVFVSSTTSDLDRYRDFTIRFIRGLDLFPVAMEDWPAISSRPVEAVSQRLRGCDLYVAIVAWRYGTTIDQARAGDALRTTDFDRDVISYTEFEYWSAERLGIHRLVFLAKDDGWWRVNQVDPNREDVHRFRSSLRLKSTVRDFKNLEEFRIALSASLLTELRNSPGYRKLAARDQALLEIGNHIAQDRTVRETELRTRSRSKDHRWFIPEIGNCNLGNRYIARQNVAAKFNTWIVEHPTPLLLLKGSSGVGKTNFVIDWVRHFIDDKQRADAGHPHVFRPVMFFPLGLYNPEWTLGANLAQYLKDHTKDTEAFAADKLAAWLEASIKSDAPPCDNCGATTVWEENRYLCHGCQTNMGCSRGFLLFLDGLDELARQRGQGACIGLLNQVGTLVSRNSSVAISCRDYVYARLKRAGVFDERFTIVDLPRLENVELDAALESRFDESHHAWNILHDPVAPLRDMARHPLLLELLTQIPPSAWRRLRERPEPAHLYDLWFDEMGRITGTSNNLDFAEAAQRVAALMLKHRNDLLSAVTLKSIGLPLNELRTTSLSRFSVLVEEAEDEWSFVHDSFREYALAKTIDNEFRTGRYELLATTASLDYVGSETFRFLNDLFPPRDGLLDMVASAINGYSRAPRTEWNCLLQNCCEVLGMMGLDDVDHHVEQLLRLLTDDADTLTNQTRYNIVRCLERLHGTAPRPYWKSVMKLKWEGGPNERCFGVAAVRGFHLDQPQLGYTSHFEIVASADSALQVRVSDLLVSLLEEHAGKEQRNAGLLEVNCTCALIRWLFAGHLPRIFALGNQVCAESRGNLFHATVRLPDFENLLSGRGEFFRDMVLYYVGPEFGRLAIPNFSVDGVTFLKSSHWSRKFQNPMFQKPLDVELAKYKPSYTYTAMDT
jgi:hypothetical protein